MRPKEVQAHQSLHVAARQPRKTLSGYHPGLRTNARDWYSAFTLPRLPKRLMHANHCSVWLGRKGKIQGSVLALEKSATAK